MAVNNDLNLGIGVEANQALSALLSLTRETNRFGKKASKSFSLANRALGSFIGNLSSRVAFAGIAALNRGMRDMATNARTASRGFAEINTLLPENARLTTQAKDSIIGFTSQFGKSIQDETKGFYQIVSAGVEGTANQLEFLEQSSKAAVAGLSDVASAADVGTTLFNVFGHSGETITSIFDKLFITIKKGKTTFPELAQNLGQVAKFADSAGVNLTELTGTLAFLTKNGIKTDIAVRGLRQVYASLSKPSSQAQEAAKKLGIEFNTAAISGGKFATFMRKIAIATGGNQETLSKLFGNIRALNPILAIAKGNFKDFEKILKEVSDSGGATAKAFKVMEESADFQLTRAGKNVSRMGLLISENFEIPIARATIKLNKFLDSFDTTEFSRTIISFGRLFTDFIIVPIESTIAVFGNFGSIVKAVFFGIASSITSFAMSMVKTFSGFGILPDIVEKALSEVEANFTNMAANSTKAVTDAFDDMGASSGLHKFFDIADKTVAERAMNTGKKTGDSYLQGLIDALKEGKLSSEENQFLDKDKLEQEFTDSLVSLNSWQLSFLETIDTATIHGKEKFIKFAKDIRKFSAQIKNSLMSGIGGGAANAFAAFGKALVDGNNGLKAFLNAFLKSMGQMAVQVGQMFILKGIAYTYAGLPNGPALIAAGAGLATFGGVMGALFGGGGEQGGGITAGDNGGLSTDLGVANADQPETTVEKGVEVTINVDGNVVDNDRFFQDVAEGLRESFQKDGTIIQVKS